MITKETMEHLDRLGFGADVDSLETYVGKLQEEAAKGKPIVDDAVYDEHVRLLKQLKPNSIVLNRNWENEDEELDSYDAMLKKYGMRSIETILDMDDLYKFKQSLDEIGHPVDLIASIKENGHGVRAVYIDGKLHGGSTRGRYKKGRDITRHLKAVLPNYIEKWEGTGIIEIRGEMLVSIANFEKYLKDKLKTPLSSVTSLIRESVTDEELKYLDMVCYKIFDDGKLGLKTLNDEFRCLKENGFKIPEGGLISGVTSSNLENKVATALHLFENKMDNHEIAYSCDGIVFAINEHEDFYSLGLDGNSWKGNFALKVGRYWASNVYSSEIIEIEFIPGKSYLTPKAKIVPIKAANGAEVSTVPLYNIGVMERYNYVPGETIYFRFGGETGVTTCDLYGNSVKA